MLGRIVVGLGVGIASLVVPVYLSEISPVEVRGTVVAFDILLLTSGQFISSVIAWLLGHNWRVMLGLAAIPSSIQFVSMFFMPESQRWLAKKERQTECIRTLAQVYKPVEVRRQLQLLENEITAQRQLDQQSDC